MSTLQKAYFNGFTRVILLGNTKALGLTYKTHTVSYNIQVITTLVVIMYIISYVYSKFSGFFLVCKL